MKLFTAAQLREWDQYTIEHEPVRSIDLMERAASACATRILELAPPQAHFMVFAGPGNNGGDGFAIARMLTEAGRSVTVLQVFHENITPDCRINRDRWTAKGWPVTNLENAGQFPPIPIHSIIIDALFGTGQNRALEGLAAEICRKINASAATVISIDLPSGMFADRSSAGQEKVRATHTLSLQVTKHCFLVPENADYCGNVEILDIGLHPAYPQQASTVFEITTEDDIRRMLKPRPAFAHKGNFGNALIMAGSEGMTGAACLTARACLRSGAGKVYTRIPRNSVDIMQAALPEAIVLPDSHDRYLGTLPENLEKFDAVGIGPGLGQEDATSQMIRQLLDTKRCPPLVLDADALNIIAAQKLINNLPAGSILTPHAGEFGRLFGISDNDFLRIDTSLQAAKTYQVCIILKGKYTLIATPGGRGYFNPTGNPGMAKGGSGDLLTGMITAFLAQQYDPEVACRIAVYIHGLAGDLAARDLSETSLIASDLIEYLGKAFLKFQ